MFPHSRAVGPLSQAAARPLFCSTRCRVEVQEKEVGGYCMFAMVVGAAVALILIGLPLAIIGLFIMSILTHNFRAAIGLGRCLQLDEPLTCLQ
jgi:hypothetical protein